MISKISQARSKAAIILITLICLSPWLSCQASELKGSKPAAAEATPQQTPNNQRGTAIMGILVGHKQVADSGNNNVSENGGPQTTNAKSATGAPQSLETPSSGKKSY